MPIIKGRNHIDTVKPNPYSDRPLFFSPKLACEVGIPAAIIYSQLRHWIYEDADYADGYWWCKKSATEMRDEAFPFWTSSNVRKALLKLKRNGYIISRRDNGGPNYYAIIR